MGYNHPEILKSSPYYDDFDDTKNFLRILFKPGYAVQARELTQLQTLLQNQISKFGSHIFKSGSQIFGGGVNLGAADFIRTTISFSGTGTVATSADLIGKILTVGSTQTTLVRAKVVDILAPTASDPYYIIVLQYLTGNVFVVGTELFIEGVSTGTTLSIVSAATNIPTSDKIGICQTLSVDSGIFYTDGFFVNNTAQTTTLHVVVDGVRKFRDPILTSEGVTNRIGFDVVRTTVTSEIDSTLTDPARGFYNYSAPGADRYVIDLQLNTHEFDPASVEPGEFTTENFVELARVVTGVLDYVKKVPTYAELTDTLARRTYDESGNYTTKPFELEVKNHYRNDIYALAIKVDSGFTQEKYIGDHIVTLLNGDKTRIGKIVGFETYIPTSAEANSTEQSELPTVIVYVERKKNYLDQLDYAFFTSSTVDGQNIVYYVNANFTSSALLGVTKRVTASRDPDGVYSPEEGGDDEKYVLSVKPGKAYVFGYEFETINNTNIVVDKDRSDSIVSVDDYNLGANIGNYFIVEAPFNSWDTTIDLEQLPYFKFGGRYIRLTIPQQAEDPRSHYLKYWSPLPTDQDQTAYRSVAFITTEGALATESLAGHTNPVDENYLHLIDGNGVLLGTDALGIANDDGYIRPQNTTEPLSKYIGGGTSLASYSIVNMSNDPESNISRMVFTDPWHGNIAVTYDLTSESAANNTSTYTTATSDLLHIKQIKCLDTANPSSIQVTTGVALRWVPASSTGVGIASGSTLYTEVLSSISYTGGTNTENAHFNVDDGVVFTDPSTSTSPISYGTSITYVSREANTKRHIVKPNGSLGCNGGADCSDEGQGGYFSVGDVVTQNYTINGQEVQASGEVLAVGGDFSFPTEGSAGVEVYIQSSGVYAFYGINDEDISTQGVTELGCVVGPCGVYKPRSSVSLNNPTCGELIRIGFKDSDDVGGYITNGTVFQYNYISLQEDINNVPSYLTSDLVRGKVVSWNENSKELIVLETQGRFEKSNGTVYQLASGTNGQTKYGGRGWDKVKTKYSPTTTEDVLIYDIEKVSGIFIDVNGSVVKNFIETSTSVFTYGGNTANRGESIVQVAIPNVENYIGQAFSAGELVYQNRGTTGTARGILLSFTHKDLTNPADTSATVMIIQPTNEIDFIVGSGASGVRATSDSSLDLPVSAQYATKTKEIIGCGRLRVLRRQEETAYQAFFFDIKMDFLPDLSRKYNLNEVSSFYYEPEFATQIINNFEDEDIQLVSAVEDDYIFIVHPDKGIDVSATTDNFTFSKIFDAELNNLLFMLPGSSSAKSVGEMDYRIQQQVPKEGDFSTDTIKFSTGDSFVRFIGGESSTIGKVDSNDLLEHYTLFVNDEIVDLTSSAYSVVTNNYSSPSASSFVEIRKTNGVTWTVGETTSVQLIVNLNVNPKPNTTLLGETVKGGIRIKSITRNTETVTLKKTKDGLYKANLTKADIISIDKVTVAGSSVDIKNKFDLFTGQTDNLYDFGQVTLKNEYLVANVPESTSIIVSYQYFDHLNSGPITIDSYVNTEYKNIPYYTSTATGKVYKLDSVVDMRPVMTLSSGKGIISQKWIPAPASSFDVDFEYYLSKAHKLVITRDLKFKLISGRPAFDAELPSDDENAMTLYNIVAEPYVFDRSDIIATMVNNRRYTMKDIIDLDSRIQKLEQYTILNSLEMKALSEQIIDVNTQLDRVRTSVLVDNFSSHATGDTVNTQYNISIDTEENTIRPPFIMNAITLNETDAVLDNLVKTSDNVIMLPYDEINLISQYASSGVEKVNPFNDISWIGMVKLSPSSDAWFDTQVLPDVRENNNGVNDAIVSTIPSVANNQNNGLGMNYRFWKKSWFGKTDNTSRKEYRRQKRSSTLARQAVRGIHHDKRTNPAETTTSNTVNVGQNKIVDRSVVPFIRPKTISAVAEGLRPYTTVYVFFDDVDISSECMIINNVGARMGTGELKTNRYGSINFSFDIKSRTFKAGEKVLVVTDSSSNNSALASTVAEAIYNVSGAIQTSESNYVSTRKATKKPSSYSKNVSDPVAQTFFVDPLVYPQGVFISSVDLFFSDKDSDLPVSVELRPTNSGYPVSRDNTLVYPFATVIKYPEDITTTATANLNNSSAQAIANAINSSVEDTRTRFTFSTPVHLLPGEHSLVVKTNSSEYALYVAEMGQNLLNGTGRIAQQAAIGSFYKSQNAGKWQAYDNIDLMFAINRCTFTGSTGLSGTVTLTDMIDAVTPDQLFETLTVNNDEIKFNNTDIAYSIRTVDADGATLQANSIPITINNHIDLINSSKVTYNGESIELGITLTSSDAYISPMFDLDRLIVMGIHNIVENNTSISKTNANYNGELEPITPINSNETARTRYITKIVELEQGFESSNVKVTMGVNLPAGTKIQVFLKQQSVGKDSRFDEEPYIQLTSSKPTYISPDGDTYEDLFFTLPTDLDQPFSKYAVKLCLFSDNPVNIPKVKELRVVSLV